MLELQATQTEAHAAGERPRLQLAGARTQRVAGLAVRLEKAAGLASAAAQRSQRSQRALLKRLDAQGLCKAN